MTAGRDRMSRGKDRRKKERRHQSKLQRVEIKMDEVTAIVERTRTVLSAEDHATLTAAVSTLASSPRGNDVEPFGYLVALLPHCDEVTQAPVDWRPRNHQETLTSRDAGRRPPD